MFDARCFNIPKEEVTNLVYWRQDDASRNSIQMVGQANFSHKELHKKSRNDIQDMLMTQKGINWNDFPTYQKRGSCCVKREFWIDKNDGEEFSKEYSEALDRTAIDENAIKRTKWIIDTEIPIFKGEGREYIDRLVFVYCSLENMRLKKQNTVGKSAMKTGVRIMIWLLLGLESWQDV